MELDHIGGTHGGNRKPTPFMCLVTKMLQIQPEKDIVVEFIKNEDYKYVRVLGAFYLRLTGNYIDVYRYLEPLYNDYRKLRLQLADGSFGSTHVDEFIDELLSKDYSCDIALPRMKKRWTIESIGALLEPRKSALEDDFEEEDEKDEDNDHIMADVDDSDHGKAHHRGRSRSPTRERDRKRGCDSHRYRDRDYDRDRGRGRDRDRVRRRSHSRSPSRKKEKKEKKDDGTEHPDPEIAEANRLRASLGLKPLRM